MKDHEILNYLINRAPIEQFYLFTPLEADSTLIKYIDSNGTSWSLMEDDNEVANYAIKFLIQSGAPVFKDYPTLLEHERSKEITIRHRPLQ